MLSLAHPQGVHEQRVASEDYMRLESLVQKVVSPYLGTHGLYSGDGSEAQCCVLGEWERPRVLGTPVGNNYHCRF